MVADTGLEGQAWPRDPLADPQLRHRFDSQGYVGPYPMLAGDLLAAARDTADQLIAGVPAGRLAMTFELHDRHLDHDALWAAATYGPLLDVVSQLLGQQLMLIGTRLVCKIGGRPSSIPWHQDIPFMGLDPARTVTAWLALDDSDWENGTIALVPGPAHRPPRQHHKVGGDRRLGMLTDVEADVVTAAELEAAIRPTVPAGAVLFFGGGILHGGTSNASARRRCAMTIRFVGGGTKPLDPLQWAAVCVRGTDSGAFGGRDRAAAEAYRASRD
jgi:non-haem Fe2+, alpha-ketoglutarate-dependent halogenase